MESSPRETRLYFGCAFLFAALIRPIGESVRTPTVRFADSSAITGEDSRRRSSALVTREPAAAVVATGRYERLHRPGAGLEQAREPRDPGEGRPVPSLTRATDGSAGRRLTWQSRVVMLTGKRSVSFRAFRF
ncbi:hypothetical protein ELS17_04580 [Natrinema altunense]|uniref:Uncharacterized protein n=1 Tax=Natrinema altunense TaxID=222984 RepID=A0A482XZU6_9EURY|nr:hypothetical protein ELS17_04580 [Natrinema altunense]